MRIQMRDSDWNSLRYDGTPNTHVPKKYKRPLTKEEQREKRDSWIKELFADEQEDRARKDYIRESGSLFERLYLWVTGEEPECFSRHFRPKFGGAKGQAK
tara:strand:- start:325 stop:624 length:300 start_codon:yes stop_codon:yes gene_type:complete